MKKILFLLLFPLVTYSQITIPNPFSVSLVSPPISLSANIDLTFSGEPTSSGWNNIFIPPITTPMALLTPTGGSTGWTLTSTSSQANIVSFVDVGPQTGDSDFPSAVINNAHYINIGSNTGQTYTIHLAGLDPTKTYTGLTAVVDNGGTDGPVKVTIGGVSHTITEINNVLVKTTFTGCVSDGSGNMDVVIGYDTGSNFPILNAFKITQN